MIVKACDNCRKLLAEPGSCVVTAIRQGEALMFRKGNFTTKGASHLCSLECSEAFFGNWLDGELSEIESEEPPILDAKPSAAVVVVPPDAEDAAMRNQILASVIGRV